MKVVVKVLISLFFLISCQYLIGQNLASPQTEAPDISIYLHTDRNYYLEGEAIYFKAYIFDNTSENRGNDILYITLFDQQGLQVASGQFSVNNSLMTGSIELPEFLSEGAYILVASTGMLAAFPEKMYSGIINIISPDSELNITVAFADSLFEAGSKINGKISFHGKTNKPVSTGFRYKITGPAGELQSGRGKSDRSGKATLELKLPDSDNNENLKLIITPENKKTKNPVALVIPTKKNNSANKPDHKDNHRDPFSISIKTNRLPQKMNAELEITVTDNDGIPVMANLSVSAADVINSGTFTENYDLVTYLQMDNIVVHESSQLNKINISQGSFFGEQLTSYFTNKLIQTIQQPGKLFVVQEKNNERRFGMEKAIPVQKQEGYTSDRDIYDILMQIKPYHLESNMIIFGMQSMYSINNPEGAIIVVDGIKMGTDATLLGTIPVPDISKISVSTNTMDIQRYSAMNTVGVIEITMKKSKEFLKNNAPQKPTNTLFWNPEMITDPSGKTFVSFPCYESKDILIRVNGVAANGMVGSHSIVFQAR